MQGEATHAPRWSSINLPSCILAYLYRYNGVFYVRRKKGAEPVHLRPLVSAIFVVLPRNSKWSPRLRQLAYFKRATIVAAIASASIPDATISGYGFKAFNGILIANTEFYLDEPFA